MLISKTDKVALSAEKSKGKEKTTEEHCKEFEREIDELSFLEDEVVEKQPQKQRVLEGQDAKR